MIDRNADTGEKILRGADGQSFPSIEEAARAEAASFARRDLVLDPRLREALADPAHRYDSVGVILVFGHQPAHEVAESVRRAYGPRFKAILHRMRTILGRIAEARAPDPVGGLQLGHRQEEEDRLLAAEERAELRALGEECHELRRRMRREILAEARAVALPEQAPLVTWIESRPGGRVHGRSTILNAVSATLPVEALEEVVERFPGVHRIVPVESVEPSLDVSVPTVGASSWTGAGYSGSSFTKVAIIDSGIDSGHPALSGGIVSDAAVHLSYAASLPSSTSGFADSTSNTDDLYNHGTHVGGIVASNDSTYKGVAPGARLMNAKAFYKTVGGFAYAYDPDILDAGDWAADNGADVVNASFGFAGATYGNSNLALFFDALVHDLAISATVSAGNTGSTSGTVRTPADAFNVIAVGNVQTQRTASLSDDGIYSTSSRGPLSDGRRKPDLSAPGTFIYSCWYNWETQVPFALNTGTSMAAPHVAGALALLEDYSASWSPEAAKALLLTNVRNVSPYPATPDDNWGYGGLNLASAFANRAGVAEGALDATGSPVTFFRLPAIGSGGRVTLCWNRQVTSNSNSTPTTYHAPADLDLYLYDGTSGTPGGSSVSGLNNIEQVKLAASLGTPVVKVKRSGSLPTGVSRQDFGLAAEVPGALSEAKAPTLVCTFVGTPLVVGPDTSFPVTVAIKNEGGIPAFSPVVTLALPPGYTLVSGANPRQLPRIDGSSLNVCSWTVRTPDSVTARGTGTLQVTATSSSFEETFQGGATFAQDFEPRPPAGSLTIAEGAGFVDGTAVSLRVEATGGVGGVVEMRFGNDGSSWSAWSPWESFASTRDWDLAAGPDGSRNVWGQVRDAEGNASLLFSDTVSVDTAAPRMTFVLNGGTPYLVPSLPLVANTTYNDGNGSGAADFRASHDGGATWTDWIPLDSTGAAEIPRPPGRGRHTMAGQVRDRVGLLSAVSTASVHLVEDDPQPLSGVKRLAGTISVGGDIDSFGVDLVAGDVLSVSGTAKVPDKYFEFSLAYDLWDPDGAVIFTGQYPDDSRRDGVRKFTAQRTGLHVLVVRPVGWDATKGAPYTLKVKVRHPRINLVVGGEASGGKITFEGARGATVSGKFRGTVLRSALLVPPGMAPSSVELGGKGGSRTLGATLLDGPTGPWEVRFAPAETIRYHLRIRPPRAGKVDEAPDLAGP